jgi:hypothetical protein
MIKTTRKKKPFVPPSWWTNLPDWARCLIVWRKSCQRHALTAHALASLCQRPVKTVLQELIEAPNTQVYFCYTIHAPVWHVYRSMTFPYKSMFVDEAKYLAQKYPKAESIENGAPSALTARLTSRQIELLQRVAKGYMPTKLRWMRDTPQW